MIPRLVPEISPLDAFCDIVVAGVVVGIGDSRSWICLTLSTSQAPKNGSREISLEEMREQFQKHAANNLSLQDQKFAQYINCQI